MSQRPSTLQRQTDAFRARVLAMEAQSTQLLSATYADALTVLEPRILALSEQIAAAQAAGEPVGISWLFQQERYRELRRQLLTLMDAYGATTKVITTEAQKVIVKESLVHAGNTLLSVSGGSGDEIATLARGWASVPDESIINLVGAMQSGTPLDATIQSYGVDAVQDVQQALTRGLALGDSAQMTTQVLRALGVTRARAESLVRTETMRAARAATTAAYIQSGVVRAWRWSCARSARTCPACLALDGRVFKLSEPHKFHVNCRCSASPVLNDWPDKPDYQTGSEWLAQQPQSVQEQVLGRTAAADYRAGNLQLGDFVKLTHSDDWGDSYVNGGLTHARKQAQKAGRAPSEWATAAPITRTRKVTKPKPAPKRTAPTQPAKAPARGRSLEGEAMIEFLLDV